MTLRQQALVLMDKLKENNPAKIFKSISQADAGMTYILMLLSECNQIWYASLISEHMHISRARVAVLLNKLEQKHYITKLTSPANTKIEEVCITPLGLEHINQLNEMMLNNIMKLINNVGYDRLYEFVSIAKEIKQVLHSEVE